MKLPLRDHTTPKTHLNPYISPVFSQEIHWSLSFVSYFGVMFFYYNFKDVFILLLFPCVDCMKLDMYFVW